MNDLILFLRRKVYTKFVVDHNNTKLTYARSTLCIHSLRQLQERFEVDDVGF